MVIEVRRHDLGHFSASEMVLASFRSEENLGREDAIRFFKKTFRKQFPDVSVCRFDFTGISEEDWDDYFEDISASCNEIWHYQSKSKLSFGDFGNPKLLT